VKVVISLGVVGLATLTLLGYRDFIFLGDSGGRQLPSITETLERVIDPSFGDDNASGIEFIYHALIIDTVDQLSRYHFGINWIYLVTVHLIPRTIWPEKPYGFDSPGITPEDIRDVTGIGIAAGSAPGMVADVYRQFGPLCLLFVWLLGRLSRRLFDSATIVGSLESKCLYTLLYALGLNLFAQGFGSIIVPYVYASAPLILGRLLMGPQPWTTMARERRHVTATR
jgi:hypothetical protein